MNTNSNFLRLNIHDFLKGLIVAVLTAVVASLQMIFKQNGGNVGKEQLASVGVTAVIAALAYLSKNLLTNNQGQFGKFNPTI